MIIKRERLELESYLKDKSKMDKLEPLLRQQIFDFCRDSYNLHRKEEKIKRLKNDIKVEQVKMRIISKRLTSEYHFVVNELSLGRPPVNITPETKGKSFRLDINYRGTRKKVTIGKTYKELNELCKKHNLRLYNKINEKVNELNWKVMVKNHLKYYISDIVESKTKDEFENSGQIVINPKTLKLQFLTKKDEIEKRSGKPSKKQSVPDNSQNRGLGKNESNGVLKFGGGNSGWNGKVTNVDDTPERLKNNNTKKNSLFSDDKEKESFVKKFMFKQKMGGNTKGKKK
jgi:hypothetical protein